MSSMNLSALGFSKYSNEFYSAHPFLIDSLTPFEQLMSKYLLLLPLL